MTKVVIGAPHMSLAQAEWNLRMDCPEKCIQVEIIRSFHRYTRGPGKHDQPEQPQ